MSAPKDPITTHVLDSTTGLPAASIAVTLTLVDHSNVTYSARTSTTDGRIMHWTTAPGNPSLANLFAPTSYLLLGKEKRLIWSLKFATEEYWGVGKTFYPEVEVRFCCDMETISQGGGHWHVPVLLGPWGYTTYRGS